MKARLKFSKCGSMRFIGHLDVMRYFQKAFRRAGIPVSYSQGFSPHQLMSFTSPLGIGLSSDSEYLDLVLEECPHPEEMVERINRTMNREIRVCDFLLLEDTAKPSMATLAACDYLIAVKSEKVSVLLDRERVSDALDKFLAQESIEILKKTKRSEKLEDIRKYIYYMAQDMDAFSRMTGRDYPAICLAPDSYQTVLCMQLAAGSIVNIKPELVLQAFLSFMDVMYEPFSYQVHRLEMYADADGVKGELHTITDEVPCRLVPLSEYGRLGAS